MSHPVIYGYWKLAGGTGGYCFCSGVGGGGAWYLSLQMTDFSPF